MRAFANFVAAAIIASSASPSQAAPAGAAAPQGFATAKHLVQDFYYGDDYDFACPPGFHYACMYEPYGRRSCACWPGGDRPACPSGYRFTCRPEPGGYPNCACY